MDKRRKQIFRQVKAYLEQHDGYKPVYDPTIRLYADAVSRWESISAEIDEQGHEIEDRDNLPRKNPKLIQQRNYSEQIQKLSLQLGLSPYGSKKVALVSKPKRHLTGAGALRPIQRKKAN